MVKDVCWVLVLLHCNKYVFCSNCLLFPHDKILLCSLLIYSHDSGNLPASCDDDDGDDADDDDDDDADADGNILD